ncbi:MAG TPA: glycosyltransferase family 4 protein [Solirubrobacter sp.]|nr:glycosyltransferase family 4 protein [Solirubrobacter sp.]
MRILLASPGMGLGGAERVVVALASGLTARGHEVAVSGPEGALDAELPEGVRRLPLPERGRSPAGVLEWVARTARFVRSFRPHVVHAHNAKATVAAAAAVRVARGPRRPPVLATHHGAAPEDRAAAARLLRLADALVCVSEDVAMPSATVIHNGVAPPPPPAEWPGDDPLVLWVGRLAPVKNPQRFLAVAALVDGAQFVVVGDGELQLHSPHVTFLGARKDARALIARADLLVVTSDSEGQSIVVLEALSAGTPVVSTPVPGMRDLLGGGAGIITPDFTPESLAAAVRELLADPARRTRMGEMGARLVLERFSADHMVDEYARRYHALTRTIP